MAQNYDPNLPQSGVTTFGQLYQVLRDKFEVLRSSFSGDAFPTNPVDGQLCYRTDRDKLYIYSGDVSLGENGWVELTSETSAVYQEVVNSRGTKSSLDQRLDVALNEDGTLKSNVEAYQSEWIKPSLTFTYVATNQFKVEGDQTDIYVAGRRLKINLDASIIYSEVQSSSYDDVNNETIVTIVDNGIDNTLVDVEHSIIHSNTSISALPYSYESQARAIPKAGSDGKISNDWLNMSMSDLSDVDDTDKADGRILKWDESSGNHVYVDLSLISDFISLTDTPSDYTGEGEKLVRVKSTEDGLEFFADGEGSGLDADLVRGLPADFTCSKAESGYTKLPNGLIIQWGHYEKSSHFADSEEITITFPITFPNALLSFSAIFSGGTDEMGDTCPFFGGIKQKNDGSLYNFSQSSITVEVWVSYGSNPSNGKGHLYWIAIGY